MFAWLKPNPAKQLQKEYDRLTERAFQAQRNGDIRLYSELTSQAETVKAKLDNLMAES